MVGLFQPAQTEAASAPDYKIEINKNTNKLYLYNGSKVIKTYKVATGRSKSLTPEGTFPMVVKISKPGWKKVPGGVPENPLGARWNGISVNGDNGRTYGIHGTNNPKSIGSHASSGCVRMYNEDVIDLYNTIYEGTPVWIHSGKSNNSWRGDSSVGLKSASGTATITSNQTNLRTGPSTGSFIVKKVNAGTKLTITGKSGDWYQVLVSKGKKAFVHKKLVSVSGGNKDGSPKFTSASGTIEITVDVANIRSEASLSSKVITKMKKGSTLSLTGISPEWFRVKLSNGSTAYVHKSVAKQKTSNTSTVKVVVDVANIRSTPSLSASIIGKAKKGEVFTKTGTSGDWFQIRLANGKTGYLHKTVAK